MQPEQNRAGRRSASTPTAAASYAVQRMDNPAAMRRLNTGVHK